MRPIMVFITAPHPISVPSMGSQMKDILWQLLYFQVVSNSKTMKPACNITIVIIPATRIHIPGRVLWNQSIGPYFRPTKIELPFALVAYVPWLIKQMMVKPDNFVFRLISLVGKETIAIISPVFAFLFILVTARIGPSVMSYQTKPSAIKIDKDVLCDRTLIAEVAPPLIYVLALLSHIHRNAQIMLLVLCKGV